MIDWTGSLSTIKYPFDELIDRFSRIRASLAENYQKFACEPYGKFCPNELVLKYVNREFAGIWPNYQKQLLQFDLRMSKRILN